MLLVPTMPALALLHAMPPRHATPQQLRTSLLTMADTSQMPLYDFAGSAGSEALEAWERIDDVIMGGVSSSRLVANPDGGALFEGRLRSEGGGFCGQRMRLLAEPLDLSLSDGIYLDCEALPVGAPPSSRVWKMAIRTKQDRGEVVYQQAFTPPTAGRRTVRLPFDGFRLVRGPRLVPNVPPLSAAQANETYQISLVVSKFEVSETGAALSNFEEGLFALRLFAVGTFASVAQGASLPTIPRALTKEEQAAAAPPMLKILRPLLGIVFGESVRRRLAATKLLDARGTTKLGRAKLAWAWRCAGKGGMVGAAYKTTTLLARDLVGAALSLPVKLLFRAVRLVSRTLKKLKRGKAPTPTPQPA